MRTGRPTTGKYGTSKDSKAYSKEYRKQNPESLELYRVKAAYNYLVKHGEKYGYRAEVISK